MKKLFLLVVIGLFFFSGCGHDKGIILFNKQRITQDNFLNNSKNFLTGERVYYLFIAPKKMQNDYIRVQVSKMTDKAPLGGYEVYRTKDYRLMKDERYYHTNYFVLHEKGRYLMQVFSMDDFVRPLSVEDFYIK